MLKPTALLLRGVAGRDPHSPRGVVPSAGELLGVPEPRGVPLGSALGVAARKDDLGVTWQDASRRGSREGAEGDGLSLGGGSWR